jgi:hypothetical protein
MAGREGRPGIAKWLCFNLRAQVGHVPDSKIHKYKSVIGSAGREMGGGGEGGWTIASIHNYIKWEGKQYTV